MAFTYDGTLSDPLQYIRFQINDVEEEMPIYQDGEIQYFIDKIEGEPTERDLDKIAVRLLKRFLYKLSYGPSRERAGAYEVYGITAETLKTLLYDLERQISDSAVPQPFFGGVYKSQVRKNRQNPALTDNVWERDQFEEGFDDDLDKNAY